MTHAKHETYSIFERHTAVARYTVNAISWAHARELFDDGCATLKDSETIEIHTVTYEDARGDRKDEAEIEYTPEDATFVDLRWMLGKEIDKVFGAADDEFPKGGLLPHDVDANVTMQPAPTGTEYDGAVVWGLLDKTDDMEELVTAAEATFAKTPEPDHPLDALAFEYFEVRPCFEDAEGCVESHRNEEEYADAKASRTTGYIVREFWTLYGMMPGKARDGGDHSIAIGDFNTKAQAHQVMNAILAPMAKARDLLDASSVRDASWRTLTSRIVEASGNLDDFINQCSNEERV